MSKKCNKPKSPCKFCFKEVSTKTGLQCQGACKKWAHFSCLNYTPGKIHDIKAGFIKVNCPCPDCETKGAKETVLQEPNFTCTNEVCPANSIPVCTFPNCPSKGNTSKTCPQCPRPCPPPPPPPAPCGTPPPCSPKPSCNTPPRRPRSPPSPICPPSPVCPPSPSPPICCQKPSPCGKPQKRRRPKKRKSSSESRCSSHSSDLCLPSNPPTCKNLRPPKRKCPNKGVKQKNSLNQCSLSSSSSQRSVQMSNKKTQARSKRCPAGKSKSCTCVNRKTCGKDSVSTSSDTGLKNTVEDLCNTVGELTCQVKELMCRMKDM